MKWKTTSIPIFLSLLGLLLLSSCTVTLPHPRQKKEDVWYTPDGCRVRRVLFHCYFPNGHLEWRYIRCRDGRSSRNKQVISSPHCNNFYHSP